jgi:hypothetical protein
LVLLLGWLLVLLLIMLTVLLLLGGCRAWVMVPLTTCQPMLRTCSCCLPQWLHLPLQLPAILLLLLLLLLVPCCRCGWGWSTRQCVGSGWRPKGRGTVSSWGLLLLLLLLRLVW